MRLNEYVYVSVDVETDGRIPSISSLLSIGAAKFDPETGECYDTFQVNLLQRPDATPDHDTMKNFWSKHPEAWKAARKNALDPRRAMIEFGRWLENGPEKLVFVGYPVTFDFMWIYDYFIRYTGRCPFGFSGLDIKTAASIVLDAPFHKTFKSSMPGEWFEDNEAHTHVAREDAVEQGRIWMNVLGARKDLPDYLV